MNNRRFPAKFISFILLFPAFVFVSQRSSAQLAFFKPGWQADSMKHAVEHLYNYQFAKANNTVAPLRKLDAQNPAIQIFDCLETYWKYFPIIAHPNEYLKFKKDLKKALDHTLDLLKKDGQSPENSFYALLLHIMIARQMYEDGEKWQAMQHATNAYAFIKKGFVLQEKVTEFLLTSGLYKYYREFFAEQNPVYKPFMAVFPQGNIAEGLRLLERGTTETVFVRAEAMMFASYINLRYQDNKAEGLRFATMMNTYYPENYLFKVLYTENLIQSGEYEKARVELNKLVQSPIVFFKLPSALFRGMLEERYAHNTSEAIRWYEQAIKLGTPVTKATENYVGLAHYYLANIYKAKANAPKAKHHFKEAAEYCTYVKLKKDAAKRK